MSFDSIVRGILNEGAKESKALLAKTFPKNKQLQNDLLNLDQTPSKGDVPAIIKFYNETKDLTKLTKYFNLYFKLKAKNAFSNFKIKDKDANVNTAPGSFETFIDFTELVDAVNNKPKFKNAPPAPTIEHEDSADKLVDTEELTIYKGDSQHKCVEYGKGYAFCISRDSGGNMYDSYRIQKESTFYFIFFKKIPKTNPNHVLVLDHTRTGWEWTNKNNYTKKTTWKEIVAKFPVLSQYEDLFVNISMTTEEKEKIKFIKTFINSPSLKKFLTVDKDIQIIALKSGATITDEIFNYLKNNNKWDHINEYVSVGPNLTPLQADAIKAKGGTILKQYLKTRKLAIPQLIDFNSYKFNILDKNIPDIKRKIKLDYTRAYNQVETFNQGVWESKFLFKLPDNISTNIEYNFTCMLNQSLLSLEGSPKSVRGHFNCLNNFSLTSLKGAPQSVGGDFNCNNNPSLTSLKGAPQSVGGDFLCYNNHALTSLEGMPAYVGGTITIHDNKGKFTDEDIKAAMEESKRKLKKTGTSVSKESFDSNNSSVKFTNKQNNAIETDQFNESVKDILFAILGIGTVGLYNSKIVQNKINARPESTREKIEAIQLADKRIKTPKFHQVAAEVLSKLKSTENDTSKKATESPVKLKKPLVDPVVTLASAYILPSEILGKDIDDKANDRFMIPYQDDVGKWTIGVGHLIGNGSTKDKEDYVKARAAKGLKLPLSRPEAIELFTTDVSERVPAVRNKFNNWSLMSDNLKAALIDIKFRGDLDNPYGGDFNWVKLINKGQYKKAAAMYLIHAEYKQRNAAMKKSGTKDGVVLRMNKNAEIIAKEAKLKAKKRPVTLK